MDKEQAVEYAKALQKFCEEHNCEECPFVKYTDDLDCLIEFPYVWFKDAE